MPRTNRKLTDTEIRNAKPKAADYKLYDDGGLRLLIRKTGTKVWQYPYKLDNKYNVCTLGQYPEVGASEARKARDDARTLIRQGINPNEQKRSQRSAHKAETENTFENIAREWHGKQIWAKKHAQNIIMTLEKDVFPFIGSKAIDQVNAQDILSILRTIEERGALDVAKRINQRCTAIFDYAIVKGICDNNPATGRAKIIKGRRVKHRPHLKENQLPEFLEKLENYHGGKIVQLAMKLLLLTFVRPGELRNAEWQEFSEEKAEWRIPAERMKMKRLHIVPLSKQVLEILNELRPLTGKTKFLFPGVRDSEKPISDVTLIKLLIILGYIKDKKIVPHGMRATASTILNETGNFKPDVIERQLAHIEKNKVRAAYHHSEYLEERRSMMQWWGDFLEQKRLKINAKG